MTDLFMRIPDEKQKRILTVAIREFSSCGYNNANTNRIAKQAGISVGSLYKYFENKENLFLTTIKHCTVELKSILEEIMTGEDDILLKVEKVLHTIQRHSRENVEMIRLYNEMSTHSNSRFVVQTVVELEGLTAKIYTALVEKAQREGETREDCDPRMFAFLIDNLFMMMQFSYACDYYRERFKVYAGDDIFSSDDFVVEQTLKFIKAAFKSPSANQAGGCLQTNLLQNPPQDSLRTGCENKKQNKTEE